VANHFARLLRRNVTDAEQKLWYELRMLKREAGTFAGKFP